MHAHALLYAIAKAATVQFTSRKVKYNGLSDCLQRNISKEKFSKCCDVISEYLITICQQTN